MPTRRAGSRSSSRRRTSTSIASGSTIDSVPSRRTRPVASRWRGRGFPQPGPRRSCSWSPGSAGADGDLRRRGHRRDRRGLPRSRRHPAPGSVGGRPAERSCRRGTTIQLVNAWLQRASQALAPEPKAPDPAPRARFRSSPGASPGPDESLGRSRSVQGLVGCWPDVDFSRAGPAREPGGC